MQNYKIIADSACDITPELKEKWDISLLDLSYTFNGNENLNADNFIPSKFYEKMRNGEIPKTSSVNTDSYLRAFIKNFNEGYDVLYIGFSSALSGSFNNAKIAAAEAIEKYPQRKIITVDSLCASAGYAFLLYLINEKRNSLLSLEEIALYAEKTKSKICHFFTVDDLTYLKNGGRISSAASLVGSMLGIKPILHCDEHGRLTYLGKIRGRNNSINALFEKFTELSSDKNGTVFICQADCRDDSEKLKKLLFDKYKIKVKYVADIGPVIGAHAGPGALGIFFLGNER